MRKDAPCYHPPMVTQPEQTEFVTRQDFDRRMVEVERRLGRIEHRLDVITDRLDRMNDKFEAIFERFREIDKRFQSIDERFRGIDERFRELDKRFESFDERILAATAASEDRIRREMRWGFGVLLVVVVTLSGVAIGLRG